MVGPHDHFSSPGPASLVAYWGILEETMNLGGQVPCCQVGQLQSELVAQDDCIQEDILLQKPDFGDILLHLIVLC